MLNKKIPRSAFILRKCPIKCVIPLVAFIFSFFFKGVDDQTSIKLYMEKLQSLSEYRIDDAQKHLVTTYYLQNKNRRPDLKHRRRIRREFGYQKKKLKQKWCAYYHLKWPLEHYQVNNKAEKAFQAHHIVPINAGGVNQWWNISPISDENHKKLHASMEEHACFSHDVFQQKMWRLALKIRESFHEFIGKIDKDKSSAKQPTPNSALGAGRC